MLAPPRTDDRAFAVLLGRILQAGVAAAAAIVIAGAGIYLVRHGSSPMSYHVFRGEPAEFRTIPGILKESADLSGRGLIQLGLLALISTPILRVLWSIVEFARERDTLYVAITVLVLALLCFSLLAA